MDLRLVTVAFDPEIGGFPEQPLKDLEGEMAAGPPFDRRRGS